MSPIVYRYDTPSSDRYHIYESYSSLRFLIGKCKRDWSLARITFVQTSPLRYAYIRVCSRCRNVEALNIFNPDNVRLTTGFHRELVIIRHREHKKPRNQPSNSTCNFRRYITLTNSLLTKVLISQLPSTSQLYIPDRQQAPEINFRRKSIATNFTCDRKFFARRIVFVFSINA